MQKIKVKGHSVKELRVEIVTDGRSDGRTRLNGFIVVCLATVTERRNSHISDNLARSAKVAEKGYMF